jgi:hypothetical protein
MKPGQQFRVALWREDKIHLFPETGWDSKAAHPGLDAVKDEQAVGATDAEASLKASVQLECNQLILVTAKPDLQSEWADAALAARPGGLRIDAIKIGTKDTNSPLKRLTDGGGGNFYQYDQPTLESFLK